MNIAHEPVIGGAVLLGLWMVGITQLKSQWTLYGLQSLLLGLLAVWIGHIMAAQINQLSGG